MSQFVWSQFRARRGRALTLGLGILVAALSFILLTAAASTSRLDVHGTLESNYRSAYDVLVRPRGAVNRLERSERLVRPNYLSGIFGGITLEEYEQIGQIPGVDVAAPIANVGYVLPLATFGVPVSSVLNEDPVQLYRISGAWIAGASRYPSQYTAYLYYTQRHELTESFEEIVPGRADTLPVCRGLDLTAPPPAESNPFDQKSYIACYSARSPDLEYTAQYKGVLPAGVVGTSADVYFPLFLAAIDPVAEARLLRLDSTVVDGRYLRATDRAFVEEQDGGFSLRFVPVIASTSSFVDERLELAIERLKIPSDADVPKVLASTAARGFLQALEGTVVDRQIQASGPLYQKLVEKDRLDSFSYWTVSGTRYRDVSADRVAPLPTTNGISVWESPFVSGGGGLLGYWTAPSANADVQFRRLTPHPADNRTDRATNVLRDAKLRIVGRYDPTKLPGFSALSQVPLETYHPPSLEPADAASSRALEGKPLLPTQNLGDYIQQPPLLLTTLEGMKPFLNPKFYKGSGATANAPISTIRIRVKGVTGPDELSQARVRAVAQQIHDKTGLQVDITAGSSPHPLLVELPKGKFGRPELLLREGWSKKGASVRYLQAVDRKSVALFVLVLVISAFFLGNGTLASVRARRAEIGTLRTFGWGSPAIFAGILAEIALVGALAGALGTALAAVLVNLLSLELPIGRVLLVLPLAILLALIAGLLPAWTASRGRPLDSLRPPVAARARRHHVRRIPVLALVNLARVPVRTLLGVAGLVIGIGALTVLLAIQRAFDGVLVDTLLGSAISVQVRDADLVAVTLTIALAALSIADLLYLSIRERAAELITLRTSGWGDRHLVTLLATEGMVLGLIGSAAGGVAGIGTGALALSVPFAPLAGAAAIAAAGGVAVTLVASVIPLTRLRALTPPTVLAEN